MWHRLLCHSLARWNVIEQRNIICKDSNIFFMKESNNWFNNLSPLKQLTLYFVFNWVIWFAASLTGEKLSFTETRSIAGHIFSATLMSLFMTIFFNWKKFRPLLKKNSGDAN
jgi:hypothetical protein